MKPGVAAAALLAMALADPAAALSCAARSGPSTLPLLELYTSEGCDSCPAADRWLSALVPPGRANRVVALAFHVDYWNHLGWPDRFASAAYTERQRALAEANGARFVYTPEVALQGREFTGWRGAGVAAALAAVQAQPSRANIAVEARVDGGSLRFEAVAEIPAATDRRGAVLLAAYADSGPVSDVRAGENRGVRLVHDHVVRGLSSAAAVGDDGRARLAGTLPKPAEAGRQPVLVAFVQNPATGVVLQALALPLDDCTLVPR
jgi:hypothetical protein